MRIKIEDIPVDGLSYDFKEGKALSDYLSFESSNEYLKNIVPLKACFTISRIQKVIRFDGEIDVLWKGICARCLEEKEFPIHSTFHTNILPTGKFRMGRDIELEEDEMDLEFYTGDEIDITDILLEQISLEVPMKTLCSDDCKGLCPVCGENLNYATCDCKQRGLI